MGNAYIESSLGEEDTNFEIPLRPQSMDDFVGQDKIRERLEVSMTATKQRKEVLGHCLFSGPPGLGKTTLAHIIANTMGSQLTVTSGPTIEKAGDLAGLLTNLQHGDVLFIDEIHRMNKTIEEYLYPAMEDFVLDIMIDSGPSARSVQVKLNPFTLVGATTRVGLLSSPFRSRFVNVCRLEYYDAETLGSIVKRSGNILDMDLCDESSLEIAKRSRGTPRIANNLLRWVRDFAQIHHNSQVSPTVVDKALTMLNIDVNGLDEMDKKILEVIINHYDGGPVGVNTIAVAIGEESNSIEEVYEPYLITQGYLKRTPRGREATQRAYEYLGKWNL